MPKPLQARIAPLHTQGYSIQQISAQLSISYGTTWNYEALSYALMMYGISIVTPNHPFLHLNNAP
jgi:DNA-binding CsgD family transcriptional regulator